AVMVLEGRPLAVLNVVRFPFAIRLAPALSVPAHSAPSRESATEYTLFCGSPSAAVRLIADHPLAERRRRVTPPRCRPTHTSSPVPAIEYTTSRSRPASVTWPSAPFSIQNRPPLVGANQARPRSSTYTGPTADAGRPCAVENEVNGGSRHRSIPRS